jgi:hypothetical protein
MKELNLNLNVNEINAVLRALGTLPYSQVHMLIDKIQQQAQVQLGQGNGIAHDTTADLKNN